MKKIFTLVIALTCVCAINAQTNTFPATGPAGIGTTSPDPSSVLEVVSTSKGILIPRMTKNQRDAIAIPSTGLLIFQTNSTPGFYYYSGSAWVALSQKGVSKTLNNLTPTAVNQSLIPGMNDSIDLGSASLMWRNAYLTDTALIGGSVGIGTTTPAARLDVNGDALINGITIGKGSSIGLGNTAVGLQALYFNAQAYNTAIGSKALYNNITGYQNAASGFGALYYNTTGNYNTATGSNTLYCNTGSYNTGHGFRALYFNGTGEGNTAGGYESLGHNTTGSYNTGFGYNTSVSTGDLNNAMALGANATVNASNKVRIGDGNVTVVESAAGSWVTSDGRFKNNIKEDVKGLEFIKLLRPVTYNFDTKKFQEFLMQNYPDTVKQKRLEKMDKTATAKASAIIQSGFIAQEVAEAVKKSGYNFNGVHAPENPTDNWSLSYEKLVVPLVKAVQELSQQNDELNLKMTQFENLEIENEQLKSRLAQIEARLGIASESQITRLPLTGAGIEQNIPNPFSQTTTITCTLPAKYSSAKIIIVDKGGKVLKQVNLSCNGKCSLQIDATTLSAGAYHYSLYVDGKLIDTKQMVLTK